MVRQAQHERSDAGAASFVILSLPTGRQAKRRIWGGARPGQWEAQRVTRVNTLMREGGPGDGSTLSVLRKGWLGTEDSNLAIRIQNPLSYH